MRDNRYSNENLILTIVTVHRGDLNKLLRTGYSLNNLKSHKSDFEWLVITDSEVSPIFKLELLSSVNLRIISTKDSGPFDAMAKSLKYCNGNIVNFLNSGDEVSVKVNSVELFNALSSSTFIWAVAETEFMKKGVAEIWSIPRNNSFKFMWCLNSFPHQSTFYKVEDLAQIGGLDPSSSISDWKTSVEMFNQNSPLFINTTYCKYEGGGMSSRPDLKLWIKDVLKVRRELGFDVKFFDPLIGSLLVLLLSIRRFFYRDESKL
jgi:hypothetical protein